MKGAIGLHPINADGETSARASSPRASRARTSHRKRFGVDARPEASTDVRAYARETTRRARNRRAFARNSMEPVEWRELMEEPAGGHGHGRASSPSRYGVDDAVSLETSTAQATSFMLGGGWTFVDTSRGGHAHGATAAGMSAHRGVLHVEEYVDDDVLREAVELELGFSYDEVRSVYDRGAAGGPLPKTLRQLRERLDARLLALSRSGANMVALARALGLNVQAADETRGEWCPAFTVALRRARALDPTTGGA